MTSEHLCEKTDLTSLCVSVLSNYFFYHEVCLYLNLNESVLFLTFNTFYSICQKILLSLCFVISLTDRHRLTEKNHVFCITFFCIINMFFGLIFKVLQTTGISSIGTCSIL